MVAANSQYREIERRFLVEQTSLPIDALGGVVNTVEQGYISGYPVTVRLRRSSTDGCTLTVKRGASRDREEREVALTDDQFAILWPVTDGWRIEKSRYRIPLPPRVIELDIFSGRHAGLIIAEVEFPSSAEADAFVPPAWLGQEITGNPDYSNARLAESFSA